MFLIKGIHRKEHLSKHSYSLFNFAKRKLSSATTGCLFEKPKLYADVNLIQEKDYYDFENMKLNLGVHDDYEVIRKLGQGRYSIVYEGYNVVTDERVVVKILKPVKLRRIKREVKVLLNLVDGPNIVKLKDFIVDHGSKTPSLIYEYIETVDWRELYPKLKDIDIRYYIYQILKALDYAHMNGIMHRDIKPHNIIINPKTMQLRVIDWGLAEFYFPGQEYSVKVASRFFKGPELLLNNNKYDYSLDIWSLGCVLAGMVFGKEPFFYGTDNFDQLVKISKVLGAEDMHQYIQKYKLNVKDLPIDAIGNPTKKPFTKFINTNNSHLCTPDCLDLLGKMIMYDHAERITTKEALEHPYFLLVKDKIGNLTNTNNTSNTADKL